MPHDPRCALSVRRGSWRAASVVGGASEAAGRTVSVIRQVGRQRGRWSFGGGRRQRGALWAMRSEVALPPARPHGCLIDGRGASLEPQADQSVSHSNRSEQHPWGRAGSRPTTLCDGSRRLCRQRPPQDHRNRPVCRPRSSTNRHLHDSGAVGDGGDVGAGDDTKRETRSERRDGTRRGGCVCAV